MISTKYLLFIPAYILLLAGTSYAQSNLVLKGIVKDAQSHEVLPGVVIRPGENEDAVSTDALGRFRLSGLREGKYRLTISCVGYATKEKEILVDHDLQLDILLEKRIVGLEEVSVTAKAKTLGSGSVIERSAIIHTQPTSLADVLQLVPGQLASNPDLGSAQQVNLRQIASTTDAGRLNALGTQVVMDGVPVSNNANLQTDQTILNASPSALPPFSSVAGRGNDLRQIPADNIESIEVIRGIPSARYGDLTSGLIVVSSRMGKSAPQLRTRFNPNLMQAAFTAGMLNSSKDHAFNIGLDLLNARSDVRDRLNAYSRVQGQLSSQKQGRKLTVTTILSGYKTLDRLKQDPDDLRYQSRQYADDFGFKISNEGKWNLNSRLLDQLTYTIALTASRQKAYYQSLITRELFPLSTAMHDTTMAGVYGRSEYLNQTTVDGKPVNGYGRLEALWIKNFLNLRHRIMAGSEWRMDANYGSGRQFDLLTPPRQNYSVGDRPRSYKEIPALHQIGLYVEDRFSGNIGNRRFSGQIGARMDNMAPENLFRSRYKTLFLPRINLAAEIISGIWLRGGYGIAGKTPPLNYLYPGTRYFDLINFNHYAVKPEERLVVITTRTIPLDGIKINPYTSEKWEVGLDAEKRWLSLNVSAFRETTRGGIGQNREVKPFTYEKLKIESRPEGRPPVLSPVPASVDTFYAAYDVPVNNRYVANKGIEFAIDISELKAIRTSFNITGAYIQTDSYDDGRYTDAVRAYQGNTVPSRIGIYHSSSRIKAQRLNTSVRFIHRIPSLNIVFSALVQTIWISTSSALNVSPYPVAYMDKSGKITELTAEMARQVEYSDLVRTANETFPTHYPPLHLMNIRLTKEWKRGFGFSFYANNFLNHRPLHYNPNSQGFVRRNEPLFFGFEFNLPLGKQI